MRLPVLSDTPTSATEPHQARVEREQDSMRWFFPCTSNRGFDYPSGSRVTLIRVSWFNIWNKHRQARTFAFSEWLSSPLTQALLINLLASVEAMAAGGCAELRSRRCQERNSHWLFQLQHLHAAQRRCMGVEESICCAVIRQRFK